jgi:uncharacterized membrane protein
MTPFLLKLHVAAGFIALISGIGAMWLKHNTPVHRIFGKVYFRSMTLIFLSALPLSVLHEKWFLLFINFFTFYSVCIAYRSIIIKTGNRKVLDWIIDGIAGLTNFGLLTYGVFIAISKGLQNAVIPLVFGIAGVYFVANTIYNYHFKTKKKLDWLRTHIGNMMGSYIGAVTAFTVNQAWKWDVPAVVAWFGPSILIVPLIIREIRLTVNEKRMENEG